MYPFFFTNLYKYLCYFCISEYFYQYFKSFFVLYFFLGEAIKKIQNYGHCPNRGGGVSGWRSSSKVVFYKKVCILNLWTVSLFEIDIHASKHMNFWITYQPKPYQKNSTFWFLRNWFCNFKLFVSKCQNAQPTARGGGLVVFFMASLTIIKSLLIQNQKIK